MELCPTIDMIGNYFAKSSQGYQFRRFYNIIIVIHEDDILDYNASRRYFLEEKK